MPRGSYTTEPTDNLPTPRAPLAPDEPRVFAWARYGDTGNATIDPRDYGCITLAATLADAWFEVATEVGRPHTELFTAVRQFAAHVDGQLHAVDALAEFGLEDLRRRHLDAWESDLLTEHRAANSDTAYRKAIYLFALLRRIEEDTPGTLHPEVLERLESDTRLWHHRNEGVPGFTDSEVRSIRGHAHRTVHAHLSRCAPEPTPEVLAALHVMLSLSTGEPPEVIRTVTINDIAATATAATDEPTARLTHAARLTWLAERDAIEEYAVTYTKQRSHETYQDVYRRRNHSAHRALTKLLAITAALRAESGNDALWLVRRADGTITQPPWNSPEYRLGRLLADGNVHVTGKAHWMRLRKVAVAREAAADPTRYLRARRRHTPETFFAHYTNNEVLKAKAGRILIDSIDEKFTAAIMGPTVVTPDAEDLIAHGQQAPGLDADTAQALVRGDLDGPQTACRNPRDSPFAPLGEVCKLSMTGTCFGCGNALITEHHLPAALVIADVADPDKAANIEVWRDYWKPIYETITQVVLPAFPPEAIESARARTHLVPLDLGTRNDLRGTDDD
jgi:hypothetical protein